jgi:serine/threonine protein kinase
MGSGGSGFARTVSLKTELGDSTALAAGTVIAERYRVQHLMGEGGLGAVYQVEHVHMRKTFALKVLHGGNNAHPEVTARFEREAIAASHIEHPNVASATDFGRLPDGSFFLVLEYVAGRTLRSELKGGALPLERALRITRGIVAGVAAAHARGIVHRDLKPDNIMLVDKPGQPDFVKLLDFGIARIESVGPVGREAAVEALTVSGVMI